MKRVEILKEVTIQFATEQILTTNKQYELNKSLHILQQMSKKRDDDNLCAKHRGKQEFEQDYTSVDQAVNFKYLDYKVP